MSHASVQSQSPFQVAKVAKPSRDGHPKLREVVPDDYAQLAALTAPYGFPPSMWTREQWQHVWDKNPAYLRTGGSFPRGWALETDGQIVGYIATFPHFYQFNGQQLLVANGFSFIVKPEYRGYAPFVADQYWNQKIADVVTAHQTKLEGFRTHTELGVKAVPLGGWDRKAVWVTNYREFLADRLTQKGVPAAGLLAYPAGAALSMKDAWDRMLLRRRTHMDSGIEFCSAFDRRFDDFWRELCAQYPRKFLAARTQAALEWRFHFALREQRIRIVTFTRNNRLSAYAIFLLQKNGARDRVQRMIAADFQSLDGYDAIFNAMLQAALQHARRSGIHLLVTMGFSASGLDISAVAPYRGPLPQHPTSLYKTRNPKLSSALDDPLAWCPSLYDGDMSL